MDEQVSLEPRIAAQLPGNILLGVGFNRHHDPKLVAERTAQNDEAFLDERIHHCGVLGEA